MLRALWTILKPICFVFAFLGLFACSDGEDFVEVKASSPSSQDAVISDLSDNELLMAATQQTKDLADIVLVYSANMQGELEPCGCTPETDYGGILRRAAALDSLRVQYPDLVLVSAGGILDIQGFTQAIKNSYILKAFERFQYDALGVQWRDLTFGWETLNSFDIPWVVSNYPLASEKLSVRPAATAQLRIKREAFVLSVFSLLPLDEAPLDFIRQAGSILQQGLIKQLELAKRQGETTVLLLSEYGEDTQQWIKQHGNLIDILIAPNLEPEFIEPRMQKSTLILQPGHRGMRLGVVGLRIDETDHAVSVQHHQVYELDTRIENPVSWQAWYDEYNEAVRIDFEKEVVLKKQLSDGDKTFVGAQTCKGCHQSAFEIWESSVHAKALNILKRKNKVFDPECVKCHVVGFGEPGGFINESFTPELAHVQCESCHGPRAEHIKNPTIKMPIEDAEAVCTQCHNKAHSPSFDYDSYWPKIEHSL